MAANDSVPLDRDVVAPAWCPTSQANEDFLSAHGLEDAALPAGLAERVSVVSVVCHGDGQLDALEYHIVPKGSDSVVEEYSVTLTAIDDGEPTDKLRRHVENLNSDLIDVKSGEIVIAARKVAVFVIGDRTVLGLHESLSEFGDELMGTPSSDSPLLSSLEWTW